MTKQEIDVLIDKNVYENTGGEVTAAKLNNVLKQIVSHAQSLLQVDAVSVKVVEALPTVDDAAEKTIYLVPKEGTEGDVKNEYLLIDGKFELIGNTKLDLSEYGLSKSVNGYETITLSGANITLSGSPTSEGGGKGDVKLKGAIVDIHPNNYYSLETSSKTTDPHDNGTTVRGKDDELQLKAPYGSVKISGGQIYISGSQYIYIESKSGATVSGGDSQLYLAGHEASLQLWNDAYLNASGIYLNARNSGSINLSTSGSIQLSGNNTTVQADGTANLKGNMGIHIAQGTEGAININSGVVAIAGSQVRIDCKPFNISGGSIQLSGDSIQLSASLINLSGSVMVNGSSLYAGVNLSGYSVNIGGSQTSTITMSGVREVTTPFSGKLLALENDGTVRYINISGLKTLLS